MAAGFVIMLGLFAWRQVREARKLRVEQARPFVIVDFEPGFLVYLTVENLGRTMAREVRSARARRSFSSTTPTADSASRSAASG